MFLSKLMLPAGTAGNPYELHRMLWKCFPDRPDAARGFLFRIDESTHAQPIPVLMQSSEAPKGGSDSPALLATRPFAPVLCKDMRLRFRLRANPVKAVTDRKGRLRTHGSRIGPVRSCRVPLLSDASRAEWLVRKLDGAAQLSLLEIAPDPVLRFNKKNAHEGKIVTVLFDGELIVTDPAAFVQLMAHGVGPAKAFGCGLLSIAPA